MTHPGAFKITPPQPLNICPRPRLFKRLDRLRKHPVIWLSAPAGSGKTSLITRYLKDRGLSSIWYQIDPGDCDLASFFYYMGLAARRAAPRRKALPLFTPEYFGGMPAFAKNFFKALYPRIKTPGLLVLDNYQELPETALLHAALGHGLRELPEGLSVVLISRSEPPPALARLRFSVGIGWMRWRDLRLTFKECAALYRSLTGIAPQRERLQAIHKQIDGWAAGLMLWLNHAGETGIDLDIQSERKALFDDFARDIFEAAPEETRFFLLKTSLLKKMTPSLTGDLTGLRRPESVLKALMQRNCFIVRRPGRAASFAYHPLFRAFLLSEAGKRFSSEVLTALRRRAGSLLEQNGEIEEAADLYKEAGDWEALSCLIPQHAEPLFRQGRIALVEEWLLALPDKKLKAAPWLSFWLGNCRLPFDPPAARGFLETAFDQFKNRGDFAGCCLAWASIVETFIHYWEDFKALDHWITVFETTLIAPHPTSTFPSPEIEARVVGAIVPALAFRQPDHPMLPYWAERAGALTRGSGGVKRHLTLAGHLCHYYAWTGEIDQYNTLIEAFGPDTELKAFSPLAAILRHVMKAVWGWQTASWEAGEHALIQGLKTAGETGVHLWDLELIAQGVYAHASRGDIGAAERFLNRIAARLDAVPRLGVGHYHYLAAWVAFLKGRRESARRHADLGLQSAVACGVPFPEALNRLAAAQIAYDRGERESALTHLHRANEIGLGMKSRFLLFQAKCLRAFFAFKEGEEEKGLIALKEGLGIGKQAALVNTPWWRADMMTELCLKALAHNIEVEYVQGLIRRRHLRPDSPPVHLENWPWPLRIYTFGRFSMLQNGKAVPLSGKAQRRPMMLLKALLAFGGREVPSEQLEDALWPDLEGGASYPALTMALKRLRRLLGGKEVVQLREGKLTLDSSHAWVDSWAFERMVEKRGKRGNVEISQQEAALDLYHGPFLREEIDASWALSMRERLRRKFLRATEALAERFEIREAWKEAIMRYEKGLDVDPLAEEYYYRIMRCHARLGNLAEALTAYRHCREILKIQLEIAPSDKMETLYQTLRRMRG